MNIIGIDLLYDLFLRQGCVATDSRTPIAGAIFFALSGDRFNGNCFAEQALANGCAYAVVDDEAVLPPAAHDDARYLLTDDALVALQRLAALHRRTLGTRLIAITGTNGKTTTKELLAAVLRKRYRVLATEGNLNNQIGVPLTLLRLTQEDELGIIEMGASHVGDIQELTEIARPDYGLITNVGRAHLQGFGSFEGVVRTKGELFAWLRAHGGTAFVNTQSTELVRLAEGLHTIPYIKGSLAGDGEYLAFEWDGGMCRTQLIGDYNLDNALAAVTIGRFMDVPDADIDEAISTYAPRNGRSQRVQTTYNTLIVDAYNANPTSMRASLQSFARLAAPKKGVILGAMKELGAAEAAEHADIARYVETLGFDRVIFVGEEFKEATTAAAWYANVEALKAEWAHAPRLAGYTLLLKGSNSVHLTELIDLL
jgi:UDP-N-acetylmuramoyl-tripeptide--D-alanyl-D-alanine ligase